jgi:DNA helicase-2/ATP-dependent DNA helicase PcrA
VREAEFVAEQVVAGKTAFRETAVLFRTNGQSRLLEEALRKKDIAYVVVGTTQFYARKEIKDLMAYLRLLVCPVDDVSLRRIINVPPRGLGAATLQQLEEYAVTRAAPLFEILHDVEHDQTLPSRARTAIGSFVHLLDDLKHLAAASTIRELVEGVIDKTGYRAFVGRAGDKDARDRLEILDEFVSACAQYDEREQGDLVGFLHGLALVSDVDGWESDAPAVTLMTCHSAKGLEFENVFLVGLEEGLLPHASALNSDRELEEERRLCYVAMTRARKQLTLSYARRRMAFGEYEEREPSRFLTEVPADEVVRMDLRDGSREAGTGQRAVRREPARAESGGLRTGMQVRHAAFGPGTVMSTTGSGKKQRARIRFRTGRTRTFMVASTPLEIVDRGDHR